MNYKERKAEQLAVDTFNSTRDIVCLYVYNRLHSEWESMDTYRTYAGYIRCYLLSSNFMKSNLRKKYCEAFRNIMANQYIAANTKQPEHNADDDVRAYRDSDVWLKTFYRKLFYKKPVTWNKIIKIMDSVSQAVNINIDNISLVDRLSQCFQNEVIDKTGKTVCEWIWNHNGWTGLLKVGKKATRSRDVPVLLLLLVDRCKCNAAKPVSSRNYHTCERCNKQMCIVRNCADTFNTAAEVEKHQREKHTEQELTKFGYLLKKDIFTCTCGEEKVRYPLQQTGECKMCRRQWCMMGICGQEFRTKNGLYAHQNSDCQFKNRIIETQNTTVEQQERTPDNEKGSETSSTITLESENEAEGERRSSSNERESEELDTSVFEMSNAAKKEGEQTLLDKRQDEEEESALSLATHMDIEEENFSSNVNQAEELGKLISDMPETSIAKLPIEQKGCHSTHDNISDEVPTKSNNENSLAPIDMAIDLTTNKETGWAEKDQMDKTEHFTDCKETTTLGRAADKSKKLEFNPNPRTSDCLFSTDDIVRAYILDRLSTNSRFEQFFAQHSEFLKASLKKESSLSAEGQNECIRALRLLYKESQSKYLLTTGAKDGFLTTSAVQYAIASIFENGEITWSKIVSILNFMAEAIATSISHISLIDVLCHYLLKIHVGNNGLTVNEWISLKEDRSYLQQTTLKSNFENKSKPKLKTIKLTVYKSNSFSKQPEKRSVVLFSASLTKLLEAAYRHEFIELLYKRPMTEFDKCLCGYPKPDCWARYPQCAHCGSYLCVVPECLFTTPLFLKYSIDCHHLLYHNDSKILAKYRYMEENYCECGARKIRWPNHHHGQCQKCKLLWCLRGNCAYVCSTARTLNGHKRYCLYVESDIKNHCSKCQTKKIRGRQSYAKCPIDGIYWCLLGNCIYETSHSHKMSLHLLKCHVQALFPAV